MISLHALVRDESATQPSAIQAELVDMFDRRAPTAVILLNIVFAALLTVLWWHKISAITLLCWFAAVTLVAIANIIHRQRYVATLRRQQIDPAYWRRSFINSAIANGMVWSAAGVLLYSAAQPLQSAFVLLLICGITAGVAASQASLWRAVVLFALIAIGPPAIAIAVEGGPLQLVVSALLTLFLIYILFVGHINHRTLVDSIRLRFENVQLLDELQEREQHFRSLVENAPDIVAAIAADGALLFHSPSTEAVLGYPKGKLTRCSIFDLLHPNDHEIMRNNMARLLVTPTRSVATETRWRHHDGHWRLLHCVARRLGDREPAAVVVNARDITERKLMEDELRRARDAAEQASRIKSQFLATMSHEIRTPMHAILGMADLLQQSPLSEDQESYVRTFQSAGHHLLALIDDILDLSRLEAGGLQLADASFCLAQVLDDVTALLGPQAKAKKLDLRIDIAPAVTLWRRGDQQRLRQVLVNLIGNAIKFTDHGHIALEVTSDPDDVSQLLFAVRDSGIGIPSQKVGNLFTPFTQINGSRTDMRGGTGLGLSICRRLIEAMAGTITVESSEGRGSTFIFSVRLPQAEPTATARPKLGDDANSSALPQARLLVVDDSAMNRLVIKEFLRDTPCRLTFAENGMEAVTLFKQEPFDMILMDIQMPLLDGWSATRQIRDYEAASAQSAVPIVALTASAMEEDRLASIAAGCTTFCAKPLGQHQLLGLIRHHVAPSASAG